MQARTVPQGPTADEAVREWQSLGLTTLEEVAARALAADKSDRTALTRLPIDFDAVFSETPSELARTIRYGTTDYVVVVDGTETKDVSAYDGQVLHFRRGAGALRRGPHPRVHCAAGAQDALDDVG